MMFCDSLPASLRITISEGGIQLKSQRTAKMFLDIL
jgi:hypothetical protein